MFKTISFEGVIESIGLTQPLPVRSSGLPAVVAARALFVLATGADAGTRYVANNGADSLSCGTKALPCRSITQAITNAAVGDSINVGPGFYGDIDDNGSLGGPGEESATACGGACTIDVNKTVKIFSSDGAGATVVRVPTGLTAGVIPSSAGTTFGKPNKGFTVSGAGIGGILIYGAVAGSKVGGNRVFPPAGGSGIYLTSSHGGVVQGNVVVGNSVPAPSLGILIYGANVKAVGNATTGCLYGMILEGTGWTATKNVAHGNDYGIALFVDDPTFGPPAKFDKNSTVGNNLAGLYILSPDNPTGGTTVTLGRGNVLANGEDVTAPTPNCGVLVNNSDATDALTVNMDKHFWGAVAPGPTRPTPSAAAAPRGRVQRRSTSPTRRSSRTRSNRRASVRLAAGHRTPSGAGAGSAGPSYVEHGSMFGARDAAVELRRQQA